MTALNVALAIVIRNGRVLVQHRLRAKLGMVYEFPGGKVDFGESIEEGAKRELYEETGLQDLLFTKSYSYTKKDNTTISFVILNLAHSLQEPFETNSLRKQSFHWLTLDEIPISSFQELDQSFIQQELKKYIK
ncbi:MAG: NUDIX hydrolase [Candidatus Cloacimonetes bacterium]|nr:NUDIX hydrolase [Candidatus Cloacimonadota bacterium]